MTLEIIRGALAWSIIINYGIILVWFMVFTLAHDWLYRFHGKWFSLSVNSFDALHYGAMAIFKTGILLFNLTPWLALCIVSR